ncbi:hypothetical protein [Parendozoicomonas haliclonae]|uniref:hypothetical protein n=1 Tax=Parendozoicomonas haliclonae TaxID=1960125 RepID=UPI0010565A8D|nr:hypothetical protein [Parendozoicomonas haliclonae]
MGEELLAGKVFSGKQAHFPVGQFTFYFAQYLQIALGYIDILCTKACQALNMYLTDYLEGFAIDDPLSLRMRCI